MYFNDNSNENFKDLIKITTSILKDIFEVIPYTGYPIIKVEVNNNSHLDGYGNIVIDARFTSDLEYVNKTINSLEVYKKLYTFLSYKIKEMESLCED